MKLAPLALLVACGGAPAPTAPISNAPPPRSRTPVALAETWATQAGPDLAAVLLAGPFVRLDDVCAAVHAGADSCTASSGDGIASVAVWQPAAQDTEPERLEHLALQAPRGWYVMPAFAETGNRYSSFAYERAPADDALVIRYRIDTATAGRFAGDSEHGVIVCKLLPEGIACTPKIATRRYSQSMNTSQPDWPTTTTIELACTATYAHGALTVAPMAGASPDDDYWTQEAAHACTSLPYGGTHAVAF